MKVGILGTGPVGHALGHGFVTLGHETKLGSRDAGNPKAAEWAADHPGLGSTGKWDHVFEVVHGKSGAPSVEE